MNAVAASLLAGIGFASGAAAVALAAAGRSARASLATSAKPSGTLLPAPSAGRLPELRLAGVTPRAYAAQRLIGVAAGSAAGVLAAALWTSSALAAALAVAGLASAGWLLPSQGVRDAAKRAREEFDQVIRLWIVLAAQQVSAGAEPAHAMLIAAQAGQRPTWRMLHRHLHAALNERRPVSEGLADLVDRYALANLSQAVGAFGLAARRGTRMADAVLAAADNLWRDALQREREAAERRNQIIVLPATAVALALAAILIYPPFVSLTGGIIDIGP